MDELCVRRQVQVTTTGFLPLPFLVAGTDLVAVVPERLALRVAAPLGLAVAEPPFGRVELIETLWWHPDRAATPEHAWLRRTLTEAAAALPPVAADVPVPHASKVGATAHLTGTRDPRLARMRADTWHSQSRSPRE